MTGFWKTTQIVTLSLFHFIGPTNGYTCTLHIHSAIARLSWLVCFSRVSFANPVNPWLRQWDSWRVLNGRHGPEIHPSDGEMYLTPFKHVWAYGWNFLHSLNVHVLLRTTSSSQLMHYSSLIIIYTKMQTNYCTVIAAVLAHLFLWVITVHSKSSSSSLHCFQLVDVCDSEVPRL